MNKKTQQLISSLLCLFLFACISNPQISGETSSTAIAFVQTSIFLTQTITPTSFLTPIVTIESPTLIPTPTQNSILIITPDASQVKKWKEYQSELAKLVLSHPGGEYPFYEDTLCEWDILGHDDGKLYVWAECAYNAWGRGPAVIYVETDGSIKGVEYAFPGYGRDNVIKELFPLDVQLKIYSYFSSARSQEMIEHIKYRFMHPEEPPLIVLLNPSTTP